MSAYDPKRTWSPYAGDEERSRPRLPDFRKGCFDLGLAPGLEDRDFFPDRARAPLGFSHAGQSRREIRVQEHCDGRGRGNDIVQQPQAFLRQFRGEDVDTGRIAVGSGEAGDEPRLDWSRRPPSSPINVSLSGKLGENLDFHLTL